MKVSTVLESLPAWGRFGQQDHGEARHLGQPQGARPRREAARGAARRVREEVTPMAARQAFRRRRPVRGRQGDHRPPPARTPPASCALDLRHHPSTPSDRTGRGGLLLRLGRRVLPQGARGRAARVGRGVRSPLRNAGAHGGRRPGRRSRRRARDRRPGRLQVREKLPSAVLILLEPPSLEELERRLRERGTEDEERLAEPWRWPSGSWGSRNGSTTCS